VTLSSIIDDIRLAAWLDGKKFRLYAWVLLALLMAILASEIGFSHNFIDHAGQPLGPDFMSFYAASKLALSHHVAEVWNTSAHEAAQNLTFHKKLGYWAFFYPPPYLVLCLPFGLFSYPVAVILWSVLNAGLVVWAARLWLNTMAPDFKCGWLPILAFPAIWMNMANGQNAGIMTSIWLLGAVCFPKRPIIAGLIWGLLIMKPQLAMALPFFLLASGRYKALLATGLSAALYLGLSLVWIGPQGLANFIHVSQLASKTLDLGLVSHALMQSLYAALRQWGLTSTLSYLIQGLWDAAIVGMGMYWARGARANPFALCALMASASLMLSPFILDYDLLLCALPVSWLIYESIRSGFRPWEKIIAALIFILPFITRATASFVHLPLGPFILLALFICIGTRLSANKKAQT